MIKRNALYSEMDLLNDPRESLVNEFLSRARIDRKAMQSGGYIGYYSQQNIICNDERLAELYKTNRPKA